MPRLMGGGSVRSLLVPLSRLPAPELRALHWHVTWCLPPPSSLGSRACPPAAGSPHPSHSSGRFDIDRLQGAVDYAEQVLGPCELTADYSWTHQMSLVLRLRDASGTRWFLKRHRDRDRYLTELAAYRQWVPALGDRAPRLRAHDDPLQAIIMSAVAGEPAPWPAGVTTEDSDPQRAADAAVQHQAGALLRRIHDARPAVPWSDFGRAKLAEFDQLSAPAAGLLTAGELRAAREKVEALSGLGSLFRVPCHRDYTPRNWLAGADGLFIVDFEWWRPDVWISDLARLHLGIWENRPDLRDAFLRGYGRELDSTGQDILRGCAVLTASWCLVKARETGQRSFEDGSRIALQRLLAT